MRTLDRHAAPTCKSLHLVRMHWSHHAAHSCRPLHTGRLCHLHCHTIAALWKAATIHATPTPSSARKCAALRRCCAGGHTSWSSPSHTREVLEYLWIPCTMSLRSSVHATLCQYHACLHGTLPRLTRAAQFHSYMEPWFAELATSHRPLGGRNASWERWDVKWCSCCPVKMTNLSLVQKTGRPTSHVFIFSVKSGRSPSCVALCEAS